jgi:hypothetical protein
LVRDELFRFRDKDNPQQLRINRLSAAAQPDVENVREIRGGHIVVYVVAGSSGQTESGSLNHPVMFLSLKKLGSLVLDVEGPELKATFLTDRSKVLDYFTIRKQP